MDANLTDTRSLNSWPSSVPVVRYRFTVQLHDTLIWPEFPGALLRSVFGLSLRKVSCITGKPQCTGCQVRRACPYTQIFETPFPTGSGLQPASSPPNPYVIEPPTSLQRVAAGSNIAFNLVLFGNSLRQLPIACQAISTAMRIGIGTDRSRGEVTRVEYQGIDGWKNVFGSASHSIADHPRVLEVPKLQGLESTVVELLTPLRLQQQGKPLSAAEVTPRKFVSDLLRRFTLLYQAHAGVEISPHYAQQLLADTATLSISRDLQWYDVHRYSARQRQTMTLGGLGGTIHLQGDLSSLFPLLWAGQWLHVGKNTTMGHGRYVLHLPPQACKS